MIPALTLLLLLGVVGCCLAIADTEPQTPYAPSAPKPVNEAEAWRRFHREGVVLIGRPPRELARSA